MARALVPLTGLARYSRVRVFASLGPELIGSVDIWNRGADVITPARLRDALADRLGGEMWRRQILADTTSKHPATPRLAPTTVSVILPTCERPDDLRRCLDSLLAQRTRHTLEVIVVDNCPSSGVASAVVGNYPSARLVAERRPGLSFARNTGITHASGEIIVATDDDVTAPPTWIERLVEPFARPEVMAVTGHVLPVEMETEAQVRFEAYGGLGKGFFPFEVNGPWFASHRGAVPTWNLGATANAAFRVGVFADPAIGLMDEALGAGTPTGCSEDSYLFYRILKAGHTIVYEPSAFVHHRHRQTMTALRRQIYGYSKGHVAYHLTTWMRDGDRRALTRLFYSLPVTYARRAYHRLRRYTDYPLSLIVLEMAGNLAGPLALWRSRRRLRRLGPSSPVRQERRHVVSMESPVS